MDKAEKPLLAIAGIVLAILASLVAGVGVGLGYEYKVFSFAAAVVATLGVSIHLGASRRSLNEAPDALGWSGVFFIFGLVMAWITSGGGA